MTEALTRGRRLTDRHEACDDEWISTKGLSADTWMAILEDEIDFRSLAMGEAQGAAFTAPNSRWEQIRSYFDGLGAE